MKLNKIAIIAGGALALASLASCANCDYVMDQVKYSPDGKVVIEETHVKKTEFKQGWSDGAGKTVDVHPELSVIGN